MLLFCIIREGGADRSKHLVELDAFAQARSPVRDAVGRGVAYACMREHLSDFPDGEM